MTAKYHMTVEQNIFVAKRNIVDYIYKSAHIEGIPVTYPDTAAIYDGMSVAGYRVKDIVTINNLKHGWQFVLDTIGVPVGFGYISQINKIVGEENVVLNAGALRLFPVKIGGTSWQPEIPDEEKIREKLAEIHEIPEPTERAINLMLYIMRCQMFLDGNKRTAMLAANSELIAAGGGIISIPVDKNSRFFELLIEFYETGDNTKIADFVYDECIDGMNFEPDRSDGFDER